MNLISIRGATTVENNNENDILLAVDKLLREIELKNDIKREEVINITFTATKDLDQVYPAVAARKLGYLNTALMCLQEMYVENSLEKCIRVNIFCNSIKKQKDVIHTYKEGAKILRPDLGGNMNNSNKLVIAIDGPAGAGKSTVAKEVAKELDITYIDTGAMYRAITYKIYKNNINLNDIKSINELLKTTNIDIDNGNILLDGKILDKEIRQNYISQRVSNVAKIKEVREKLVEVQRNMSKNKSVVMDGRDIGSIVLPNADFKFFITATVNERARRRFIELREKGDETISLEQIKEEIRTRDKIDSTREIAPLIESSDAIRIDNSDFTPKESLETVINIINSGKNAL